MSYTLSPESRAKIASELKILREKVLNRDVNIWKLALEGNQEHITRTWCDYGLPLIGGQLWEDVVLIYSHMLATIIQFENKYGTRVHKGIPTHNLGLAYFKLGKYSFAEKMFHRAFVEDIKTKGCDTALGGNAFFYIKNWDRIIGHGEKNSGE